MQAAPSGLQALLKQLFQSLTVSAHGGQISLIKFEAMQSMGQSFIWMDYTQTVSWYYLGPRRKTAICPCLSKFETVCVV
jgi:hypothetical protein